MTAIVDSFFPLLALILLGWFLRRRNLLGAGAARELTAFVVWLALPSLLFEAHRRRVVAASCGSRSSSIAYAGAMVVTFVLTFWWLPKTAAVRRPLPRLLRRHLRQLRLHRHPAERAAARQGGADPRDDRHLADRRAAVRGGHRDAGARRRARDARPLASVAKAARAVARNPLVVATVLGGAVVGQRLDDAAGAASPAGTAGRRGRAVRAGVDRRAAGAAGARGQRCRRR